MFCFVLDCTRCDSQGFFVDADTCSFQSCLDGLSAATAESRPCLGMGPAKLGILPVLWAHPLSLVFGKGGRLYENSSKSFGAILRSAIENLEHTCQWPKRGAVSSGSGKVSVGVPAPAMRGADCFGIKKANGQRHIQCFQARKEATKAMSFESVDWQAATFTNDI